MVSIMQHAITLDPRLAEEPVKYVGLFPRGYVSLVAGEPGVGKTWFMLDVARSVADGRLGMGDPYEPYERGKVLLFAGETGVRMLVDRMNQLGGVENLNRIQVISSHQMARMDIDVMLNTAIGRKNIEDAIRDYRPDIVFIDTVISFMGDGKDESSQVDMSDSIRVLGVLANTCNTAIVLLHHFRKRASKASEEARSQNEVIGTSAFTRLTSLVIGLERKGEVRYVHCLKSWWKEFNPFSFRIIDKGGKVVLAQNYSYDSEGARSTVPASFRILDWLAKHKADGSEVTIAEVSAELGIERTAVAAALDMGLAKGRLILLRNSGGGKRKIYAVKNDTGEKQLSLNVESA